MTEGGEEEEGRPTDRDFDPSPFPNGVGVGCVGDGCGWRVGTLRRGIIDVAAAAFRCVQLTLFRDDDTM